VPEELVIEIMGLVAQIGKVAQDYHQRFIDDDMGTITNVYERIIKKLMDLDEYGEKNPTFDEMLDSFGLKRGDTK
tara:strand:+ start:144 stop:368 length:225 start_codon:yes stop_codon:yes gene_type:complete